ncbi:Receptor-type tyrosine-protein phosphatase beta [Papilio machaon]|uniref:Receptor-type tyrosine-protein phosphatase beta n=1 Tax=Papilio machaon TaxID=76193 RepID=A0A194R9G1_PAPMA|nr:Receptor-type tyrosine-protein phosphatase beta [Papilio machaon]
MESPVRICIGAAIVVNLLLICTLVNGGPLSHEASSTTIKDEKTTKYSRMNSTWTTKNQPKTPDVALNELHPKESTSEEHTEKNAKYKDRGRVKFQSHLKSTSESPLRRIKSSTEPTKYVSSTTETMKSAKIANDIGKPRDKKSSEVSSSTTSSTTSEEEEITESDDMQEMNDSQLAEADEDNIFDRYTSSKFQDSFNLPGYNDDDSYKDKMYSQTKHEFSNFDKVLKHFSKNMFDSSENDNVHGDPYNSHSYFDFEADLTTPRNDYFDQKYADISSSIMNNLASVKTKSPEMNSTTPQDIITENIGFEKLSNGSPNNKSMMIIKNTKEIRRLDNDQAGTANRELSDIHGTSIYYEMSVLSTETYNINHSDDYDCDNDTLPAETTMSTSLQEEDQSLTAVQPVMATASSMPVTITAIPAIVLPNVIPNSLNTIIPIQDSNIPISSQNYVSNTERTVKVSPRNRNYSKRLNLTGNKVSPNSVTPQTIPTMNSGWRPVTHKFYFTTPKIKPIWIAPRRNISKVYKTSYPTTIYAEHFNIKDKYSTTPRPMAPQKTILTTLPSDIDPVLQSDVSGVEKFVQSQIITDNTIPTLSKRGSMKFTTSVPLSANNTEHKDPTNIIGTSKEGASSSISLTNSSKEIETVDEAGTTASVSSASQTQFVNKISSTDKNTPSKISTVKTITPNLSVSLDEASTIDKTGEMDLTDPLSATTNSESDSTEEKDYLNQTGTIGNSSATSNESLDQTESVSQSNSKNISETPFGKTNKVREGSPPGSTESVGTASVEDTDNTSQTSSEWVTSVGGMSINDLEIPPTMTAWALASLRTPPTMSIKVLNGSQSTQKTVDENELQKVSEPLDQKETTTVSTTPTTTPVAALSNYVLKNITEIDQNKLPWKPIISIEVRDEKEPVTKSERLPAESNISVQSSLKPENTTKRTQTEEKIAMTTETIKINDARPSWIPAMINETTTEETDENEDEIQPVDVKKSTGFESITKLPSGVTTPTDENDTSTEQSEVRTTTDYDITTIRFSYVPTEQMTETEVPIINKTWHKIIPTRTNKPTTPITTYRPTFSTTTEETEETTTMIVDTTPQLESSSINDNATNQSHEGIGQTTTEEITTNNPTTTYPTTSNPTTANPTTTNPTTDSTTECDETTTMTTAASMMQRTDPEEMPQIATTTEPPIQTKNESISEENSDSNEVIQDTTKPPTTTTIITTTTITTTTEKGPETTVVPSTTEQTTPGYSETTIKPNENIPFHHEEDTTTESSEMTTKSINELEDLTSYTDDMTTEASSRVFTNEETSSGATIAIVVTTIGVTALILLVVLLLVVRRRGRRGVYAQRCTPVSLDAYSLDSVSVGHRKGNHRLCSKRSYGNPAYDDEVTSHPMQYAALANFALDVESISAEFAEIPSVSVPPEAVPPGCEDKNRYSNVLPLPETRVPLTRLGNDPTTEYMNANYVTGPGNIRNYYILCQAPLANTVADFWRMIWEQNSRLIVMLTEYMENGVEKCYEYLPPSEVSDNKRCFGDFQVVLKKREQRDKYAISTLQLIHMGTRTWREVTHLWYFWPAKGVPDDYDSVIDFISEMRSYMKISQTAKEYDEEGVEVIYGDDTKSSLETLSKLRSEGRASGRGPHVYSPARAEEMMRSNNGTLRSQGVRPCVCVCASGAGRSAAMVALETCARALSAGAVDVPRVVRRLRAQRPHALANRHHYIFIYKVLSEYGNKLMGSGVDNI